MPPSVTRRASIRIVNLPSGPSNATLLSSAFSIDPPRAKAAKAKYEDALRAKFFGF
jgi:hypothetical protein